MIGRFLCGILASGGSSRRASPHRRHALAGVVPFKQDGFTRGAQSLGNPPGSGRGSAQPLRGVPAQASCSSITAVTLRRSLSCSPMHMRTLTAAAVVKNY